MGPTPAACGQLIAMFNSGRYAELEFQSRLLAERYPESGFVWKALGISLKAQGKEALPALQKAAELLPNDAEAHKNLGVALTDLGQFDKAVASYRRALKIKPDYAEAYCNLGNALKELAQLDEAITSYRHALAIDPGLAEAHCNLGNAMTGIGQFVEAVASYLRALEIKPDYAEAYYNLGVAQTGLGQVGEAVATYLRALEIKPDYAEVYYNLGNILIDLGQLDEAAASYLRALEIKPDYAEAHNNLGNILKDLRQLDEAAVCYRRALEIKPDYAEAHSNLGLALQDLGQLDEAVASYLRALKVKPACVEAHCNLGNALRELGQLDDAVTSYRRALEIKPDFSEAYGNLGAVFAAQGKLDEALACYRRQVELTPENGAAQHHIASLTGKNTERAPAQYVEEVFDGYAHNFDMHLQQKLKCAVPEKLTELVTQHVTSPAEKWNVLDLGCGTGLAGLAFAPFARQLVGVDLSTKMLEKARGRNLYQRLEHSDLLTMMRDEKDSTYDVIIAADVFVYLGKLDEIIPEIKRLLSPGGVAAFSIETLEASSDEETSLGGQQEYRLDKTGRYAQSVGYITRLASANNFQSKAMVATPLRIEGGKPVNGHLVLWQI